MPPAFVPPSPNCGHGGVTFTHQPEHGGWLCTLCLVAIRNLARRCARCRRELKPSDTVCNNLRGAFCVACNRDELYGRRRR